MQKNTHCQHQKKLNELAIVLECFFFFGTQRISFYFFEFSEQRAES
jgi:hypothetical protein